MDINRHKEAFDSFYRRHLLFNESDLKKLVFPLADIDKLEWGRGPYGNQYYTYHYRRFSCHALSKLSILDGQRVLNIGCGFGLDEKNIKFVYPSCEIWSIDISRFMLEMAKQSGAPSQLCLSAAEALPFGDECFDRVLCREVIEHVLSPPDVLREIRRVLKPGGRAVVSSVNADSWSPSTKFGAVKSRPRAFRWRRESEYSIVDDAISLGTMKVLVKESGLVLHEYFYDGALYFYLDSKQRKYRQRLASIAKHFSCLENDRLLAPIFCDQVKYVLEKGKCHAGPCAKEVAVEIKYVCPDCRSALVKLADRYSCENCRHAFLVENGIPDFILKGAEEASSDSLNREECRWRETYVSSREEVWRRISEKIAVFGRRAYSALYFLSAKFAAWFSQRKRKGDKAFMDTDVRCRGDVTFEQLGRR